MPEQLNDFCQALVAQLNLEANDAAGQGDRVGAHTIQRISNAFSRAAEVLMAEAVEEAAEAAAEGNLQ